MKWKILKSQLGGSFKALIAFFGVTDALLPPEPLSLQVFNNLEWRDAEDNRTFCTLYAPSYALLVSWLLHVIRVVLW